MGLGHPASLGSVGGSLTASLPSGTAWPIGLGQAHPDHFSPDGLTVSYIGTFIISAQSLLPCHRAEPNPRGTALWPQASHGGVWTILVCAPAAVRSGLRPSGADWGSDSPLCPGAPSVASYLPASLRLPFYPRDAEVRTWYRAVTSDHVVEGPGIPSAPPHQPPDPPVPASPESRLFSGAGPIRHSL